MDHLILEEQLNQILKPELIKDYCPNGMQVEGRDSVQKIVTGVTASQALIEAAIAKEADALLVHHGYFWKGEPASIKGMKAKRLKALIQNDINLYAYHLPLDIHPTLGNNAQLAQLLDIHVQGGLEGHPQSVAMYGELNQPQNANEFAEKIEQVLARKPLHISPNEDALFQPIKKVGWCTGGGQDYIELAASQGCDAFISGEISERTTYIAREMGIHYFSAGHHATERYGVKALGEYLAKEYQFDVEFIDIDNPV